MENEIAITNNTALPTFGVWSRSARSTPFESDRTRQHRGDFDRAGLPVGRDVVGAGLDHLAGEAARGDRSAIKLLLATVRPLVIHLCRAELAHEVGIAAADAVAEDVCRSLLRSLPERRGNHAEPFLRRAYQRTCAEVSRVRKNHRSGTAAFSHRSRGSPRLRKKGSATSPPTGSPISHPTQLLARLSTRERAVIVLRVGGGWNVDHTAVALHSTPESIRQLQHRALAKLRTSTAQAMP